MSQVFFIPSNSADHKSDVADKVTRLFKASDSARAFEKGDLAALKLHLGEPGCITSVSPNIVKPFVKCMRDAGAKPFLTDTAVLYKSQRDNGVDHTIVSQNRGFGISKMGAPFLPADGLVGADEIEVPLEGGHIYETVTIASGIMHARSMLVLSHATGHLATGLGGALKNLGMGCVSKKAKLVQHFGQNPRIESGRCTACGECEKWCPSDAIEVSQVAAIDPDKCIGCGECIAVCLDGAVSFDWSIMGKELQERIVEHAAAVVRSKPKRIVYCTAALTITKDCDCMGIKQTPLLEDLGLFASFDPVAIDKAVADAIESEAGQRLEAMSYPKTDCDIQLEYAEAMGLGSQKYELVEI